MTIPLMPSGKAVSASASVSHDINGFRAFVYVLTMADGSVWEKIEDSNGSSGWQCLYEPQLPKKRKKRVKASQKSQEPLVIDVHEYDTGVSPEELKKLGPGI